MVPLKYLEAVRAILSHLESTQLPRIEEAANIVAESLANGGAVFCAGIGHNNQDDFLGRAGGLAALQRFTYNVNIDAPVADCLTNRPRPEPFEMDLESVRFAVRASEIRAGDVVVVGSVSGRNRGPIELAIACREMGVRVIGITSMEYTSRVISTHPSGKKLFEVCDVVIDNGAPYGDAAVEIPGYDFNLLPVSGTSAIIVGWMLWGRVMENMAEAGNPPSVYMSINREGGQEYYEKTKSEYNRRGY
ncbi:MAG: sugar isomerase domain-containing protein [Armatimonadetes bacterium]|nr:sugar isomerase domain-containing protein [Armatimonadota bacterium]